MTAFYEFSLSLAKQNIAAVSDLKILFPKEMTLKFLAFAFAISSSVKPPSGPIKNNESESNRSCEFSSFSFSCAINLKFFQYLKLREI